MRLTVAVSFFERQWANPETKKSYHSKRRLVQTRTRCIFPYHLDISNLRYDIFGGSARNFFKREPGSDLTLITGSPTYAIVDSVIELFFEGVREFTVTKEEWDGAKTLAPGKIGWATGFLKFLAGKILDTRKL
eukprot:gene34259-41469_t